MMANLEKLTVLLAKIIEKLKDALFVGTGMNYINQTKTITSSALVING